MAYNRNIHEFADMGACWAAIGTLNTLLGIPASEDAVTQTYAVPKQHPTDNYYYVAADDVTRQHIDVMGEVATKEFPEPNIDS